MSGEKLKRCPFCGADPTTSHGGKYAICEDCHISMIAQEWNTRKGEVDLKPAINTIERIYSIIPAHWHESRRRINEELARLRKEGGE